MRIPALNDRQGYIKLENSFLTIKFGKLHWPVRHRIDACKMLAMLRDDHVYMTEKLVVSVNAGRMISIKLNKPMGRSGFDLLVVDSAKFFREVESVCKISNPEEPWERGLVEVDMSKLGQQ